MTGRQVIETSSVMTREELYGLMQKKWNTNAYNSFEIGRPTAASVSEYILLPATDRFCVIVYPARAGLFKKGGKVVLSVCETAAGALTRLATSVPTRSLLAGVGKLSVNRSLEEERKGPAEEALLSYAAHMREILT